MSATVTAALNGANSKMVSVITGREVHEEAASERQDFRHSGVHPVKTTAMVGAYSEAWTRKTDQAGNIRNVKAKITQ